MPELCASTCSFIQARYNQTAKSQNHATKAPNLPAHRNLCQTRRRQSSMSVNVLQVASGLSGLIGAYALNAGGHWFSAGAHVPLMVAFFASLPVHPPIAVIFLFLNYGCWIGTSPNALPWRLQLGAASFIGLHAAENGTWVLTGVAAFYGVAACTNAFVGRGTSNADVQDKTMLNNNNPFWKWSGIFTNEKDE